VIVDLCNIAFCLVVGFCDTSFFPSGYYFSNPDYDAWDRHPRRTIRLKPRYSKEKWPSDGQFDHCNCSWSM